MSEQTFLSDDSPSGPATDAAVVNETETASPTAQNCGACPTPIVEKYYTGNGVVLCPDCYLAIAGNPKLSGPVAFLRALLFGSLVAVVCAFISFLISYLTGYELGIVWLFLGGIIGSFVFNGGEKRGGWLYSSLAVLLTYFAISLSVLGLVVVHLNSPQSSKAETSSTTSTLTSLMPGMQPPTRVKPTATPSPAVSATPAHKNNKADGSTSEGEAPASPLVAAVVLVLLVSVGLAIFPILVCFNDPIAFLIYGFGLHKAWTACSRPKLEGPFEVSKGSASL